MRKLFYDELTKLKTPGNWEFLKHHIGMFSFLGLTPEQWEKLATKYHVYIPTNSRISIPWLNNKNLKYCAKAIHDVITSK